MHPVSFPSLDTGTSLSELWSDFQIRFSEVQPLMLFLANEIFSDLVTPDSHLEDLLIRIQWIALEYSAIRQSLFLQWLQNNRSTLTYEMVRRTLVIITRMTGYEEEDIRKYLTNSFEALIWDWGFLRSHSRTLIFLSSSDRHLQHLLRNHLDYQYFAGFPAYTFLIELYNHFFRFLLT